MFTGTEVTIYIVPSPDLLRAAGMEAPNTKWIRQQMRALRLKNERDYERDYYIDPLSGRRRLGFVLNVEPAYGIADRVPDREGRQRAFEFLSGFDLSKNQAGVALNLIACTYKGYRFDFSRLDS
jgi:hypothetical protein